MHGFPKAGRYCDSGESFAFGIPVFIRHEFEGRVSVFTEAWPGALCERIHVYECGIPRLLGDLPS